MCKILGVLRGGFGALPFCAKTWGAGRAVLGRCRFVQNPGGLEGLLWGVAVLCEILRGLEGLLWGVALLCQILGVWRGCFGALPFCAKSWGA